MSCICTPKYCDDCHCNDFCACKPMSYKLCLPSDIHRLIGPKKSVSGVEYRSPIIFEEGCNRMVDGTTYNGLETIFTLSIKGLDSGEVEFKTFLKEKTTSSCITFINNTDLDKMVVGNSVYDDDVEVGVIAEILEEDAKIGIIKTNANLSLIGKVLTTFYLDDDEEQQSIVKTVETEDFVYNDTIIKYINSSEWNCHDDNIITLQSVTGENNSFSWPDELLIEHRKFAKSIGNPWIVGREMFYLGGGAGDPSIELQRLSGGVINANRFAYGCVIGENDDYAYQKIWNDFIKSTDTDISIRMSFEAHSSVNLSQYLTSDDISKLSSFDISPYGIVLGIKDNVYPEGYTHCAKEWSVIIKPDIQDGPFTRALRGYDIDGLSFTVLAGQDIFCTDEFVVAEDDPPRIKNAELINDGQTIRLIGGQRVPAASSRGRTYNQTYPLDIDGVDVSRITNLYKNVIAYLTSYETINIINNFDVLCGTSDRSEFAQFHGVTDTIVDNIPVKYMSQTDLDNLLLPFKNYQMIILSIPELVYGVFSGIYPYPHTDGPGPSISTPCPTVGISIIEKISDSLSKLTENYCGEIFIDEYGQYPRSYSGNDAWEEKGSRCPEKDSNIGYHRSEDFMVEKAEKLNPYVEGCPDGPNSISITISDNEKCAGKEFAGTYILSPIEVLGSNDCILSYYGGGGYFSMIQLIDITLTLYTYKGDEIIYILQDGKFVFESDSRCISPNPCKAPTEIEYNEL